MVVECRKCSDWEKGGETLTGQAPQAVLGGWLVEVELKKKGQIKLVILMT